MPRPPAVLPPTVPFPPGMTSPALFRSTKTFHDLPCAHRQWRDDSHCAFVHGYSRSFHFEFAARAFTDTHFIVDFGGLKPLKAWLEHWFDHTLLLCDDDPELPTFRALEARGAAALRVLPSVSMEYCARLAWAQANALLLELHGGRAWCEAVECRENQKNAAWFRDTPGWAQPA
jgi:6-pyruvoyltetrahydropterin/6-carboxytetrahydropterin synthase